MRYLTTLAIVLFGLASHAESTDDGKNYARIACQEVLSDGLQDRVVILEQLDASFEDGKDLISPHKFYNSSEVPFSLTIYENATLEGKPLDEAISELKRRNQLPDYEGTAVHSGRGLAFVYNMREAAMSIELSRPKISVLFRDVEPLSLECKEPMTFRKPLVPENQSQNLECSTDNCVQSASE